MLPNHAVSKQTAAAAAGFATVGLLCHLAVKALLAGNLLPIWDSLHGDGVGVRGQACSHGATIGNYGLSILMPQPCWHGAEGKWAHKTPESDEPED